MRISQILYRRSSPRAYRSLAPRSASSGLGGQQSAAPFVEPERLLEQSSRHGDELMRSLLLSPPPMKALPNDVAMRVKHAVLSPAPIPGVAESLLRKLGVRTSWRPSPEQASLGKLGAVAVGAAIVGAMVSSGISSLATRGDVTKASNQSASMTQPAAESVQHNAPMPRAQGQASDNKHSAALDPAALPPDTQQPGSALVRAPFERAHSVLGQTATDEGLPSLSVADLEDVSDFHEAERRRGLALHANALARLDIAGHSAEPATEQAALNATRRGLGIGSERVGTDNGADGQSDALTKLGRVTGGAEPSTVAAGGAAASPASQSARAGADQRVLGDGERSEGSAASLASGNPTLPNTPATNSAARFSGASHAVTSPARLNAKLRAQSDSLREETRLLEEARSKLGRAPAEALSLALEHQRRFARGQLLEQRRLIHLEALLRLGRDNEAQKLAGNIQASLYRSRALALLGRYGLQAE